ncbi:hypothetical protein [Dokdonella sp.]|uniref:hypothetical protein n=1 Tax=Dokdonella sp. TaxID=2291710 RepID=UPI002F40A2EC
MKAMPAVLAVAIAATSALAADKPVQATTKDAFATVAANVRREMEGDGRYAHVKPTERDKVERGLARMQALFDKTGSIDAMGAPRPGPPTGIAVHVRPASGFRRAFP